MAGRPPAYGPVRRAFGKVYDLLMRKEKVGEDALGNVYYRWYEGSGEHRTERREEVPAEWRMWLRRLRQDPPTPEELVQTSTRPYRSFSGRRQLREWELVVVRQPGA
eukprot:XP_001695105.1 predicted protein [Chlamydomonas reinhardtii]